MSKPKQKLSRNQLACIAAIICICGALLAVVIPKFVQARKIAIVSACINYLTQIDGAKEQWAFEHHAKIGDVVKTNDIAPYLYKGKIPNCPDGGIYTINPIGSNPVCSVPGHSL
jgi:hypothetical protein